MRTLLHSVRTVARLGYVVTAWALVAMVFVQVFHAGTAILVNAGDWAPHRNLGHLFALPILLMVILSLIAWMGYQFVLAALGLFGLYIMQYIFLYAFSGGALTALHPVNALVIAATAAWAGKGAWRLVGERWAWNRRTAMGIGVAAVAVCIAALALGSGDWPGEGGGEGVASLAAATEADVPAAYKSVTIPTDQAAVAAGRQIAEKRCIACHAADFKGQMIGANRSADLTRAAEERSEQFLLWAISEGSQKGMPSWKALPEAERLQLVAFVKSLR